MSNIYLLPDSGIIFPPHGSYPACHCKPPSAAKQSPIEPTADHRQQTATVDRRRRTADGKGKFPRFARGKRSGQEMRYGRNDKDKGGIPRFRG